MLYSKSTIISIPLNLMIKDLESIGLANSQQTSQILETKKVSVFKCAFCTPLLRERRVSAVEVASRWRVILQFHGQVGVFISCWSFFVL